MLDAIPFDLLKNLSLDGNVLEQIREEVRKLKSFTTVKIQNDGLNAFAHYELPKNSKLLIGEELTQYLESFKIEPNDSRHRHFSVSKIFNDWPNCANHLKPVSLVEYFGKDSHQHSSEFLTEPPTLNGFNQAEDWLVDTFVDKNMMEQGYYFPVPFENDGQLEGVLYLIYDDSKLTDSERESLEIFQNKLIQKYS